MKKTVSVTVLACLFWLSSWNVPADAYERGRPWTSDQHWEKLSVTFGYFLTNFSSDLTLSGTAAGVTINLEDVLGLDATTSQYRIGAHYRAWRRHHFHFGFYDLSRDAIKTLTAEIPGQDPPVLAGAQTDSGLHLKLFKVGYTFSFWNDDRVDLGAGLGFHIADIKTWVDVLAGAEGEGVIARQVLLAEETTLPLPVIGLQGRVAITKRVFLKQSFEAFYIELSGFKGVLLDANLALEGHICRFFGLGMGYNFLHIMVEGDGGTDFLGGTWMGKFDFNYSGLFIYAKFFF